MRVFYGIRLSVKREVLRDHGLGIMVLGYVSGFGVY